MHRFGNTAHIGSRIGNRRCAFAGGFADMLGFIGDFAGIFADGGNAGRHFLDRDAIDCA